MDTVKKDIETLKKDLDDTKHDIKFHAMTQLSGLQIIEKMQYRMENMKNKVVKTDIAVALIIHMLINDEGKEKDFEAKVEALRKDLYEKMDLAEAEDQDGDEDDDDANHKLKKF